MRDDNAPTRYDLEPPGSRVDPAGRVGFMRRFCRNYEVGGGNPAGGNTYSTVPQGRWDRGVVVRDHQLPVQLPPPVPMFDRTDPNNYVR